MIYLCICVSFPFLHFLLFFFPLFCSPLILHSIISRFLLFTSLFAPLYSPFPRAFVLRHEYFSLSGPLTAPARCHCSRIPIAASRRLDIKQTNSAWKYDCCVRVSNFAMESLHRLHEPPLDFVILVLDNNPV